MPKTKNLLKEGNTFKEAYDKVNALSGGVYESSSQSNELRNFRQNEEMKQKTKSTDSGELVALVRYQRENTNFLRSLVCLDQSYYRFIATDTQLNDIAQLCCVENNVFSVDTTFNLCKNCRYMLQKCKVEKCRRKAPYISRSLSSSFSERHIYF